MRIQYQLIATLRQVTTQPVDGSFTNVSADMLLFDKDERGPDDELKLQFEAVSRMSAEDKQAIKTLLDGIIIKHQTKQMVGGLSS